MSSTLLAIDRLHSPSARFGASNSIAAYAPYGHTYGLATKPRLGFTGKLREPAVGWYLLGNGYRAYNSMLMRFHSPDRLSPFGGGGINAYAYCKGDPINFLDPTGKLQTSPGVNYALSMGRWLVNGGKGIHTVIAWDKKDIYQKVVDASISILGLYAATVAVGANLEELAKRSEHYGSHAAASVAGESTFFTELHKYALASTFTLVGLNVMKVAGDIYRPLSAKGGGAKSALSVDLEQQPFEVRVNGGFLPAGEYTYHGNGRDITFTLSVDMPVVSVQGVRSGRFEDSVLGTDGDGDASF